MKSRLLDRSVSGLRTLVAVFDQGDEVMAGLEALARDERLTAAQLSAIGAFASAELAFFDWQQKAYLPIPVDEQVEVAAMLGDIEWKLNDHTHSRPVKKSRSSA